MDKTKKNTHTQAEREKTNDTQTNSAGGGTIYCVEKRPEAHDIFIFDI